MVNKLAKLTNLNIQTSPVLNLELLRSDSG